MRSKRLLLLLLFVVFIIILFFILTIVADRVLSLVLHRNGYFKAMNSNTTEVYESTEFSFKATTSSQGLRNGEVIVPKPKGTYRILALGDSFTWGWGVEGDQAWPKVLEKRFQGAKTHVEVINAGIYGADLVHETAICEDYADRFDVDMVVVGLLATDDLVQNMIEYRDQASNRLPRVLNTLAQRLWPTFIALKNPLVLQTGSQKYPGQYTVMSPYWKEIAADFITAHPGVLDRLDPSIKNDYANGKISPSLVTYANQDPNWITYILNNTFLTSSINATGELFKQLKRDCIKNRQAVVVVLPAEELVAKEYLPYRSGVGFTVDERLVTVDLDTPLQAMAKRMGVTYISLLETFRKDGCPNCYYPWDSHPTPWGQQKIAEFIHRKLEHQLKF